MADAAAKAAAGVFKAKLSAVTAAVEFIDKNVPRLEDEVTVEVVGQPGSSKKQLYFLALSVANSLVRNRMNAGGVTFALPGFAMLMLEYDAADDWVRCTLRYKSSCLWAALAAGPDTATGERLFYRETEVYAGPKCDVVGADFGFVAGAEPFSFGIPASSKAPGVPKLEFAGKTILTACPKVKDPNPALPGAGGAEIDSPNPKPVGDGRSRGAVVTPGAGGVATLSSGASGGIQGAANAVGQLPSKCCPDELKLVPLIFAALSDPGSYAQSVFE